MAASSSRRRTQPRNHPVGMLTGRSMTPATGRRPTGAKRSKLVALHKHAQGSSRSRSRVPGLSLSKSLPRMPGDRGSARPATAVQQSRNMLWETMVNDDVARFREEQKDAAYRKWMRNREHQREIQKQMEVERRRKLREKRPDMTSRAILEADMEAHKESRARRQARDTAMAAHVRAERDRQIAEAQAARDKAKQDKAEFERHALESARRADEFLKSQEKLHKARTREYLQGAMEEAQQWKRKHREEAAREKQKDAAQEREHVDKVVLEYAARDAARRRRVQALNQTVASRMAKGDYVHNDDRKKDALVERTTAVYELRDRRRHDERLQLDRLRRHQQLQEVLKGRELQVRAKQVKAMLEKERERAYAAQVAQDAVAAEAALAQREIAKMEQLLKHREELAEQLAEKQKMKVRGVDTVGGGVTELEWKLNKHMRSRSMSSSRLNTAALSRRSQRSAASSSRSRSRVLPSGFTAIESKLRDAQRRAEKHIAALRAAGEGGLPPETDRSEAFVSRPPWGVDADKGVPKLQASRKSQEFATVRSQIANALQFDSGSVVPMGASALTNRSGRLQLYYPKPKTRWYD